MSFDLGINNVNASQSSTASTGVSNTASVDDKDCSVFDSPETKKDFAEVSMSKEEFYDYCDKRLHELEIYATVDPTITKSISALKNDYLKLCDGVVETDVKSVSVLETELNKLLDCLNSSELKNDKKDEKDENKKSLTGLGKYEDIIEELQSAEKEIKNNPDLSEGARNDLIKDVKTALYYCHLNRLQIPTTLEYLENCNPVDGIEPAIIHWL